VLHCSGLHVHTCHEHASERGALLQPSPMLPASIMHNSGTPRTTAAGPGSVGCASAAPSPAGPPTPELGRGASGEQEEHFSGSPPLALPMQRRTRSSSRPLSSAPSSPLHSPMHSARSARSAFSQSSTRSGTGPLGRVTMSARELAARCARAAATAPTQPRAAAAAPPPRLASAAASPAPPLVSVAATSELSCTEAHPYPVLTATSSLVHHTAVAADLEPVDGVPTSASQACDVVVTVGGPGEARVSAPRANAPASGAVLRASSSHTLSPDHGHLSTGPASAMTAAPLLSPEAAEASVGKVAAQHNAKSTTQGPLRILCCFAPPKTSA
jgi:hypothetical protein